MKRGDFKGIYSKNSQITIFVIIALLLVAGITIFFVARSGIFKNIPSSIQPAYDYYLSCIENIALDGSKILGSQSGYIEKPNFQSGSDYAPFSSELSFMGLGVPYWYYISGNGLEREQIPTEEEMEDQLAKYVKEKALCDFSLFEAQGFTINLENSTHADINLLDNKIKITLNQKLSISKGEDSYNSVIHKTEKSSRILEFFNLAKDIYKLEKESMFLENYSTDVLNTYAPVNGVEFNCSPVIWNPYEVFSNLRNALSANIGALRINGDYYNLKNSKRNYFIIKNSKVEVNNANLQFLYSNNWAGRFEVWPTENGLMTAKILGTQAGLSMLGFCYAPYKFVYDMYFPTLIQITSLDGEEVFQFPVAVVIEKNNPRKAAEISYDYVEDAENICENADTSINVNTYKNNLEPVEADISFKCISSSCNLGTTEINNASKTSSLTTLVPQCVNGILIANSEGYKESRYVISTNEENSADIILEKEYDFDVEIYVDNVLTSETSVLILNQKDGNSSSFFESISYPLQKKISLGEGDYEFDLKVFKSGSISIPSTTTTQCSKIPREGLLGIFGLEEEKCTDITIPSQTFSNLLYAGGKENYYAVESELQSSGTLKIYATSINLPSGLEQIQNAYDQIENKEIEVIFE